jgi:hypothetical protein
MKNRAFIIAVCLTFVLLAYSVSFAQYWALLPPYNLLWPLWSPVLSPPDPLTGTPTPIITELSATTVLPMQPTISPVLSPDTVLPTFPRSAAATIITLPTAAPAVTAYAPLGTLNITPSTLIFLTLFLTLPE